MKAKFVWRWRDLLHPRRLYSNYQWFKLGQALAEDIHIRMERYGFMRRLLDNASSRCEVDPNNVQRIKIKSDKPVKHITSK